MVRPISSTTRAFIGTALLSLTALGFSQCTRKSNVDLNTCHTVNMNGDTIKIQDGVGLGLKSKTYLMDNGKLMVFDKESRTWSDAQGKIDKIYDYQHRTFTDIARATQEMGDTLVLSKCDIQYLQDHPDELELYNDHTNPYDAATSGIEERTVKSTEGNSIVIDASEDSYTVRHSTPNLTVSYNNTKETIENK